MSIRSCSNFHWLRTWNKRASDGAWQVFKVQMCKLWCLTGCQSADEKIMIFGRYSRCRCANDGVWQVFQVQMCILWCLTGFKAVKGQIMVFGRYSRCSCANDGVWQIVKVQMCKLWYLAGIEDAHMQMMVFGRYSRCRCANDDVWQVIKVQMCKWQSDVHSLNQYVAELKRSSSSATTVSALATCAMAVNERWSKLMIEANEREVSQIQCFLYCC